MKQLYRILIACLLLVSCDSDKDRVLFDPDNGQTLLSFNETTANLAILINDAGQLEVTVNSSTKSSSDRSYDIAINPATTAPSSYYELPNQVTIPSGSFQGIFVIDGTDPVGEQVPQEVLVLDLIAQEGEVVANSITVNVFITCPVEAGFFTGDYLVEQISPSIFGYDTFDPDGGGIVITLYDASQSEAATGVVLESDTQRAFLARYIAELDFDNELPYTMDFVCEQVIFGSDQVTGLACSGNSVLLGPAVIENGTYNSLDDSVFDLIFQDDVTDACGQGAPDVTLRWIKQ
ncbi:MAG: hypothetical protein ABJM06_06690 [Gilvibacter sp.]